LNRKLIAALMQVDARTARFGPYGLMTDRRLTDESAAEYVQAIVEELDLPPAVPDVVRAQFESLRHLHVYGAFSYDLFGISESACHTAIELVLAVKFMECHPDGVALVEVGTRRHEVWRGADYTSLKGRLGRRTKAGGGWRVDGDAGFNGSLASLLRWSRASGQLGPWLDWIWANVRRTVASEVLTGSIRLLPAPADWSSWDEERQRRWIDHPLREAWEIDYVDNLRQLRNLVAHRTTGYLTSPVESARALRRLHSFVSALWHDHGPGLDGSPPPHDPKSEG
jgi:hypothetical protein